MVAVLPTGDQMTVKKVIRQFIFSLGRKTCKSAPRKFLKFLLQKKHLCDTVKIKPHEIPIYFLGRTTGNGRLCGVIPPVSFLCANAERFQVA